MQPVNPLAQPDWDATLLRRADFSFFHGSAWTRVLVATYGYAPVWQSAGAAWLPLMEVDSWLTGRRGIALPFTDDCAPLCETAGEFAPLFEQALAWGRARGWRSIELRGGRNLLPGAPASVAFYGHRVDLGVGAEALFQRLDGSARQAVRKAERAGVTVEVRQDEQAIRDFYVLQCLTRKRHGLPPQSRGFFLNLWRQVLAQNQGMVVLASTHGRPLAGAVFLFLGGRAIYKYGASDYRQQQLRPNNLVMWTGMQWLARQGATTLDLGKTSLRHEGLRRFKRNLGAVEHRLEYVKFDLRQQSFIVEQDGVAGWHNAVFRVLPVWLSRVAGRLLYRHWA
ncbi:MAG: GNAT family N-acetyltransferase [Verrucomicrobiae bacterium]|nr:GNAT family N-acetyltransferase [Verrucomicrobiae bacterium]